MYTNVYTKKSIPYKIFKQKAYLKKAIIDNHPTFKTSMNKKLRLTLVFY